MTPDRRQFILNAIASVGGSSLLVACRDSPEIQATDISKQDPYFYAASELALITRLSDLILPRTETPGALDVGVPGLMDGLMRDWANKRTREFHHNTLESVGAELDVLASGDFVNASPDVAKKALTVFDRNAFDPARPNTAYQSLKQLIETVYAATEYGADAYQREAVPGYWDPAVPIDTL